MGALIDIFNGQIVISMAFGIALCSTFVMAYCIKKQRALLQRVSKLSEDLRIANRGAIGMGQQIISLEKHLQRTSANAQASQQVEMPECNPATDMSQLTGIVPKQTQRQETPLLSPDKLIDSTGPEQVGDKLSLARDLLAKGKGLTEVANTCKLSFAEVSLLRALNPTDSPPNHPHTH